MFRGYVLRYLAGVAGGQAPEAAMATVPALLRFPVGRLARGLVIPSGFETERSADEAHVHRLAYLRRVGKPAIDANRVDDVRARFEASRDRKAEDGAALRLVAASFLWLVVLGGAATAAYVLTRPAPPPPRIEEAEAEPLPVEPEVPAHPLEGLFSDAIPSYVVALDARSARRERAAPRDVASTRAALIERVGREAPPLVPSLTGLLDASESFSSGGAPFADEAWLQRLVDLHDAIAAEGAPFYVDAVLLSEGLGRRRVLMSTYDVLAHHEYTCGTEEGEVVVRALHLRRLDTLSFTQARLGYTRPEVRYALVLDDRIERFLVTQRLPSIHSADESVFVRGYEDEHDTQWVTDVENAAHQDLAAEAQEVARVAGIEPARVEGLATAIVARRHAIASIEHDLRRSDVTFPAPSTYHHDVEALTSFGARGANLAAARDAERALSGAEIRAAYDALVDAYAASVAEHEVQHRLDYVADRIVHIPPDLAELTGETESEDRVNHLAERANAELSAYLAQIARGDVQTRTVLLHVASFLFDRESWAMPEAYAAVIVFSSLAAAANVPHGPLVSGRSVVRSEIAAIYLALRTRTDLSEVAARAWTTLYGTTLATLRLAD